MKSLRVAGWAVCSVIVIAGVAVPQSAAHAKKRFAAVDGLAAMHDVGVEGGKLCFTGHWHYGESRGLSSKRAAMSAAIASWQDFTNLEYGPRWSSYSNSRGRSVRCEQESGGWGCQIEARPCSRH